MTRPDERKSRRLEVGSRWEESREGNLASWDHFDRLRERYVSASSPPSDVYRVPAKIPPDDIFEHRLSTSEEEYFDLRHITSINALLVDDIPRQVYADSAGAAFLALHHFNHGIHDAVPEIRNVTQSCRTRFTMDVVDTMHSPIEASRVFLKDVLLRGRRKDGEDLKGDDGLSSFHGSSENWISRIGNGQGTKNETKILPIPSAIAGASRSAVSMPLALISGIHGVPMISHISTSTELDNRDQYPLFGRVLPPALADAAVAVDFLSSILNVGHFGILYVKDAYGSSYAQGLEHAASKVKPVPLKVQSASIPESSSSPEARQAAISEAIGQLKRSGLRYFFGIYYPGDYDLVTEEAHRQELAGPGYFWIYGDSMLGLQGRSFDALTQKNLIEASRGSALIVPAASEVLRGKKKGYETFLEHWRELREPVSDSRKYFDSKVKAQFLKTAGGDKLLQDFQFSESPHSWALLSYDSVMAILFSICSAVSTADSTRRVDSKNTSLPTSLSGEDIFASFLNISFKGLYGEEVSIDSKTGSRRAETVPFSILNFLPSQQKDGSITLDFVATHVLDAGSHDSIKDKTTEGTLPWRRLNRNFIFADGTSQAPLDLPPLEHNSNLISLGARIAGIAMCAIVVLTSIAFGLWTFRHRECRVIKQAQPCFLYVLTAGTLLMGSAIIPLGVDGLTPSAGHDAACMATPWFITVGFSLAFSALYSKEERIRKLMKRDMRRITVTARHVMKHTVNAVALNVLILVVWTLIAPFRYEIIEVETSKDVFGRSTESWSSCTLPSDPNDSDRTWWVGYLFVSLITLVNGSYLVVALYRVYLTRHIKTEFSESRYVSLSVVSIIQAWLLGTPLILVGSRVPNGVYITLSSIIFIMCQSILLLIFVPKLYFLKDWRKKQAWIERERIRKSMKQSWMIASASSTERVARRLGSNTTRDCGMISVQLDEKASFRKNARVHASTEEVRQLQLMSEVQEAIEDGQVVTSETRKMVSFLHSGSASFNCEDRLQQLVQPG